MAQLTQNLIGQSPAWLVTLDAISGLAAIDKPILVVGDPGTGKTSVAGRLHFLSTRWEQTWQAVNCAAMDGANLETRLFGGASGLSTSLLESADGGTLLLDNIEAMPWLVQEKLLGLIETGTFKTVGEDEETSVDVRILSTSSVDLRLEVAAGRFSANLLSLLAYDVITLPPLRVRRRDILPMAEKFAADMVTLLDEESFPGFSAELIEFLGAHDWPGNVRELKSVVERAVGRAWNDEAGLSAPIANVNLDPFDTPWQLANKLSTAPSEQKIPAPETMQGNGSNQTVGKNFTERTEAFELSIIKEALSQSGNHQGNAAKYLGLTYHQFRGLLRKHGLKK
ncbi:MAG: sigma 54-interacting transcriptional regulator [Robiginitomaculum sp.]|nr:sigma 54-interacting transcriptional regulator [Robiginitomaculum sp.]